jgi:hypothetical protein
MANILFEHVKISEKQKNSIFYPPPPPKKKHMQLFFGLILLFFVIVPSLKFHSILVDYLSAVFFFRTAVDVFTYLIRQGVLALQWIPVFPHAVYNYNQDILRSG